VHGYERIAAVPGRAAVHPAAAGESVDPVRDMATVLAARGYQEAITYSFIEPAIGRRFGAGDAAALVLSNPISADLAVMRQSLWPGLALAARDNLRRQQARVRLFEVGARYLARAGAEHVEERCISGIAVGSRRPEQWGERAAPVDVFDVKADVEALLGLAGLRAAIAFEAAVHPALHPGRSALIRAGGVDAGWIGELHPSLATELELPGAILFELQLDRLARPRPAYSGVSVFPAVRRDLAVLVGRDVAAAALLAVVRSAAPPLLREAFVFDIYTGPQVGEAEKSVAIGLILQDTSRTLTDEDANGVLQTVRAALGREFQARIRE
jgi:phenylalanyl-tRNA synthetase beta chain